MVMNARLAAGWITEEDLAALRADMAGDEEGEVQDEEALEAAEAEAGAEAAEAAPDQEA
jgi:hypothetical protein